ncbi:mitogen-activated protein kinase kinase kinase 20-like [Anneissia japonica]|uniref:mitogen-activated protein kinase kinase kinase 20-like n=1 Tax=Anneissia japonica TaxID=1529436 RepID=UPI0014255C00|nr:mitogen-activated protein kinase kinase kinase 20-like [Anneissia japonica]
MSSKFQISFSKLEIGSDISIGKTSKVQRAILNTEDGSTKEVAIKTFIDFRKELFEILAEIDHRNIIKLIGAVTENDKKILVMEYANLGNLYDYLRKQNQRLNVHHSMEWAKQCSSGVAYIHSQGIIHRDIKSPNFLLNADSSEKFVGVLKLCDFGIAHRVKDSKTSTRTILGGLSLKWAAPEVIRDDDSCSIYSDVYSLAVVIWELFTGKIPYDKHDKFDTQAAICRGTTLNTKSINCQDVPQLLDRCWSKEKSDRPEAREVVEQLSKISDDGKISI